MPPFDIRIERLRKGDREKAAAMLTDAFETNPAYALIFAKNRALRDGLFWLFDANLFLINRRMSVTRVVKEKDSDEIAGVFSLIPPGGVETKLIDYMYIGLPRFILKFGFRALLKMSGMDSFNKKLLTNAVGTDEYYYLSMVAVKEEYRGTGIGSFMIKHCLDELKTTRRNCRVVGLTTQLPENVTFYTRLGFMKSNEGEVTYKRDRYYNYNMKLDL